jgi:hypothetical protein
MVILFSILKINMRKILCFVLLSAVLLNLCAQDSSLSTQSKISTFLREMKLNFPRNEGSEGEFLTIEYIKHQLEGQNVNFRIINFDRYSSGHSFSSIIEASIPGDIEDTLIIACPINHPQDAEEHSDGSINIAAALALIETFRVDKPQVSLKILFIGSEYYRSSREELTKQLGSQRFLEDFFPEQPVAVLYLEMGSIPKRIILETGAGNRVAPYWMIRRISQAARVNDFPVKILGNKNQAFRLGIIDREPKAEPYMRSDYPGVTFEGTGSGTSDMAAQDQWGIDFVEFIHHFLEANNRGFPEDWDQHYLFFQWRDNFFMLPETSYLLVLFSILVLTLFYGIIARERIKKYLRTLTKNFWNLPLLLALIFAYLFLSTLLIDSILEIRNFPGLWRYNPSLFLLLKVFLTICLFSMIYQLLKLLPLSKNGSFYSAAAMLFLLADIVLMLFLNLSFSYYFLWAFFCCFIFTLFKSRIVKLGLFILSPVWLIKAAIDIFTLPENSLIKIILFNRIEGNLILAFILLPFILMLIRMDFLIKHPAPGHAGIALKLTALLSAIATIVLYLVLLLFPPFSTETPQQILLTERINTNTGNRSLEIASEAPLGDIKIMAADQKINLSTQERSFQMDLDDAPPLYQKQISNNNFLNRSYIQMRLHSDIEISNIDFSIYALESITVYDSNFPFSLHHDEKRADIKIGSNPPNPALIEITIPQDMFARGALRIESPELVGKVSVIKNDIVLTTRTIIEEEFQLSNMSN